MTVVQFDERDLERAIVLLRCMARDAAPSGLFLDHSTQHWMPLERVLGKREVSAGAMPHTIAGILPERRTDIHDFSSARHLDSFLNDPFLNLLDLIPQEHHDSAGGGVAKSSGANIDTEREMP